MTSARAVVIMINCAVMTGCTSMRPGIGFESVQTQVADRTGMRVHWTSGTGPDVEVQLAVEDLLDEELSVDAAVQIALLNNRELQAVYEELNLAQADLVQAGLLRNPIFDAEVRFGEGGSGTGLEFGVAQDFMSILYIPLRKRQAEAAFQSAILRVTGAILDLAAEVRAAFIDLQAAGQNLEMRQTVVEATGVSYEIAKRLRAAGNITELEVAQERALHEQARIELAAAEVDVFMNREALQERMGLWGQQTSWRIPARMPDLPAQEMEGDEIERRAVERSLDLAITRQEIEVAGRALGLARPLGFLDDVAAGAAAEREVEGGWSVGPALSIPIPLFDQGQGTIGAAQARLRQAIERHTAQAIRLRSRARVAQAAVSATRDRVDYFLQVMLPLQQKIVEETQLQYNAMQVSPLQLVDARRTQVETGARFIESLRAYWQARATLEHVLSGRMPAAGSSGSSLGLSSLSRDSDAGWSDGGHR